MPLVTFKALSYVEMKKYARNDPDSEVGYLQDRHDYTRIISILDIDHFEPIFDRDKEDVVTFRFEDIDADQWKKAKIETEGHAIFSPVQADMMTDFIHTWHELPGQGLLLVNCIAGVSRSGAVVTFAQQVCGGAYNLFCTMNRGIVPNAFVGRLLREAWQEKGYPTP